MTRKRCPRCDRAWVGTSRTPSVCLYCASPGPPVEPAQALAQAIDAAGDERARADRPVYESEARLLLRKHYPTGPYHPTGQLDGDCKQGCGEWPCDQAQKGLTAIGYFTAEQIRDAGYVRPAPAPREAAEREALAEALAVIPTHDGTPVTAENLRYAATHEAIRTWVNNLDRGQFSEAVVRRLLEVAE